MASLLLAASAWATQPSASVPDTQDSAAAPADAAWFVERSSALGVTFEHRHFGQGDKTMPENMGPGVALFDSDGDGRFDLYFPQGAPLPGTSSDTPSQTTTNPLFRQTEDGGFARLDAAVGAGDPGYGMGVVRGDVDNDGDLDLYVTNMGPNALYRNRGEGTFEHGTAGVEHPGWGTGAAFFDADGDGDLDLFVANYVDYAPDNHKWCGNARRKIRSYCHPDVYSGVRDVFYRNRGDGTFEDLSDTVGLRPAAEAKGLGVLAADFDRDGVVDVYVANDSTGNHLYLGARDAPGLRFREEALLTGLGFNASGAAEASMGIAHGDLDGDGLAEIFLTHLDEETNTLYRITGHGVWSDVTQRVGLDRPSRPWVGFGTVALDVEHDGDLDLVVVNGHILDNIALFEPSRRHRQPAQLFENLGDGSFRERSGALGLDEDLVGRGLAAGDLDDDGDLDLVITQNNGPARVLINRVGQARKSLRFRFVGQESPRDGTGVRLEAVQGSRRWVRELVGGGSYLSQGPVEIHLGIGSLEAVDRIEVFWPSGRVDRHAKVETGWVYTVTEGAATLARRPLLGGEGPRNTAQGQAKEGGSP